MEHIDEFSIQRFRGLRDLKLEKLGQVNLFIGNNNSGKTSVLEALSLFCDPLNGRRWYDIGAQRELNSPLRAPGVDRLVWIFPWAANDNHDLSTEGNEILLSASGSFPTEKVSASYEKFTEMETVQKIGSTRLDESSIIDFFPNKGKIIVSSFPPHQGD